MVNLFYKIISVLLISFTLSFNVIADVVDKIDIEGNYRVPNETILMFSKVSIGDNLDNKEINNLLKRLYQTNFFKDIKIVLNDGVLKIILIESPIIENINYNGIKSNTLKEDLLKNLKLKSRSSFNEIDLFNDKEILLSELKNKGYYFSKIDINKENLADNKIIINYEITLNEKSKIKKITFLGDKVFKNRNLRNVILSEEYKFWKFISGKKYLNENLIEIDKRLLKNFYLSNGFYDVQIATSFAKFLDNGDFELIYNINAGNKFSFGEIDLILPNDFDEANFAGLKKLFLDLKDKNYSINLVEKILDEIDQITIDEQYESINATLEENVVGNIINIKFNIEQDEKFFVEKINIFGNNITRENVIRNQFEIDEGDNFSPLLEKKTVDNLRSLNIFKSVKSEITDGDDFNTKIINISVEEKATGEISAGVGFGTTGSSVAFSVKENNYLGKGVKLDSNLMLSTESIKGSFDIINPNFRNSDKSINFGIQADETDRLKNFGYLSKKMGFSTGTNFEYLKDLNLGLGISSFYERIEASSTATNLQKKQAGNYWDTFFKTSFDLDKRNSKFKPNDGYRSRYFVDVPIISETSTFTNTYDFNYYTELYNQNLSSFSIMLQSATSLSDNIKLSERLYIPSNRLRGFERNKVGPKDGNDFIGGNFMTSLNFNTTLPQILPNAQDVDFLLFLDAANLWGVDYNSSLDKNNDIKSSIGIGVDWFTAIGPLSFSFSQPITKNSSDITETFRFNLGTTF